MALFAIIPDNDSSFNFLVSILYTQLSSSCFIPPTTYTGGALPVPVHFLMDEFANVSLPDDFDKILSVMLLPWRVGQYHLAELGAVKSPV